MLHAFEIILELMAYRYMLPNESNVSEKCQRFPSNFIDFPLELPNDQRFHCQLLPSI